MSLNIDTNHVGAVLLADGWHQVKPKSFDCDSYEFVECLRPSENGVGYHQTLIHGGGNSGVCATGFIFDEPGHGLISGPLTSIVAVRHRRRR